MTNESASRTATATATATKHPRTWVVAAEIIVEEAVARVAYFRDSFKTKAERGIFCPCRLACTPGLPSLPRGHTYVVV